MLRGVSTLSAIGSLWPDNYGAGADLYQRGNGTEESPYIIDSVEDLRFFAANIAQNLHNEDTFYRIEHGTYDLNGSWIPVGFQRNSGGDAVAFHGHITAEDGANIRNLGFKANTTLGITSSMVAEIQEQEAVGFFGEVGSGATITNLSIDTSRNTLEGSDYAGILAGHVVDATIKNCTVSGVVKGKGYVGGLVGFAESSTTQSGDRNTIIEDCKADKVAAYTNEAVTFTSEFLNGHSCVGGIVGFAANTSITIPTSAPIPVPETIFTVTERTSAALPVQSTIPIFTIPRCTTARSAPITLMQSAVSSAVTATVM